MNKFLLVAVLLLAVQPIHASALYQEVLDGDRQILEKAMENQKRNDCDVSNYTSISVGSIKTRGWFNRYVRHQTVSETFQTPRRNIDVVLEVDGKPLSPEEIEKQRKYAVSKMESDEAQVKGAEGTPTLVEYESRYKSITFSTNRLIRRMDFYNRRLERCNGRPAIVFNFRPKSAPQPAESGFAYLDHLYGSLWIDQEDLIPIKVRAYLSLRAVAEEEVFAQDLVKHKNGKWHRSYWRINTSVRPKIFNGEDFDWAVTRNNYKEFCTDSISIQNITRESSVVPK